MREDLELRLGPGVCVKRVCTALGKHEEELCIDRLVKGGARDAILTVICGLCMGLSCYYGIGACGYHSHVWLFYFREGELHCIVDLVTRIHVQ